MGKQGTLYRSVVDVTNDYLGPAADRFIDRQIRNHLRKNPEQLAKQDLLDLIDWIKISMAMLTNDKKLVNEYIRNLRILVKGEK